MKHSCVTCRYNNSHSELCHNCDIIIASPTELDLSNWTPKTKAQKLENRFDVGNSIIKGDIMTGYSYPVIDTDDIFGEGLFVLCKDTRRECLYLFDNISQAFKEHGIKFRSKRDARSICPLDFNICILIRSNTGFEYMGLRPKMHYSTNGEVSRYFEHRGSRGVIVEDSIINGIINYIKKEKEKKEMPPKSYQRYYSVKGLVIKDVIFNDPATIVLWSDGTKTVVKCGKDDAFDPEKGLAMAIVKRFMGTNESKSNYCDIFKKWIPEETVGEELTKITFLTAKEASEKFGMSYKRILKEISEGNIIADKDCKGHWMIPVIDDIV